jgi:hypothetical protein
MRNVAKGDVSKLCEHTRELMFELNAADETTNDLLANLIEALKEAPGSNFQRWLSNQVDLWSMRKLDWKQDGSDLMEEADASIQLIALLKELYKESQEGAPDGPVCKSLAATDERAGLRGEYENFLIPQTPSDVISTYPLATQRGVSGGDEDTDQHYVPAAQLHSPS